MAMQTIDLGTGPDTPGADSHYQANTKVNANFGELYGPVAQVAVAASQTLALTSAHHGATIVLGGSGATVSGSATALGDGFVCKVVNDTGADWTVPALTGGTSRFDAAGHTKVLAGGSAGIEIYTRSSTRYVHVAGTTA